MKVPLLPRLRHLHLAADQVGLLRELATAHRINLEGHRAAVEHDPLLAAVAEQGINAIDAQIELVERTLQALQ